VIIRKAVFVCDAHSEGGPLTFLRRATANLEYFDWRAEILIVPSPLACTFDLSQVVPTQVVSHSYSWPQLEKRLAVAINKSNPDVVVGFPIHGAPVAMRRLYRSGNFSGRFLDLIQSDLLSEYARVRANSDFASAVGCVSEACLQGALREITQLRGRMYRVYYPVPCASSPPELAASGGHRIRLAYLGSVMQQYKRVLDFIPLVSELLARNVDFELTIIGDGNERQHLGQRLRSIPGAASRVRFLGMLPNADALEELSRQHVLLLVSDVEGQAIAMLEAMALGVIPVVSDLSGLREIIAPGENGFLAPVGATAVFASHIEHLARNPEIRARIGLAAWRKVSHDHEMKTAIGRFADVLETVRQLPLPDPKSLAPNTYPEGAMNQFRIPHYIQGLKRRLMKQVVF
jgi:glycosyltransferase involved in cell wall biosynthesis